MAESDIFLRKNTVRVVGTGTTVENGIERGAFEISVGRDKTPSIRMSAQQANVNIGGGDGASTEGDLRINDGNGKTRVQVTGADDGNRPSDDRVWINGGRGVVELSDPGGAPRVNIAADSGGDVLYSDDHSVTINGDAGEIALSRPTNPNGTLEPSVWLRPGRIGLADPGANAAHISLDASEGTVSVGGPGQMAGTVTLANPEGDETITLSGGGTSGTQPQGGYASFSERVEIQGRTGTVRLGTSYTTTAETPGADIPVSGGMPGHLFIDDGSSGGGIGTSTNAVIFEVTASRGALQIKETGSLVSQPLLEIDTNTQVIELPSEWKLKSGSQTALD